LGLRKKIKIGYKRPPHPPPKKTCTFLRDLLRLFDLGVQSLSKGGKGGQRDFESFQTSLGIQGHDFWKKITSESSEEKGLLEKEKRLVKKSELRTKKLSRKISKFMTYRRKSFFNLEDRSVKEDGGNSWGEGVERVLN